MVFLDGHAEWMKLPRLAEVLRETYKRLGREEEFPEELEQMLSSDGEE